MFLDQIVKKLFLEKFMLFVLVASNFRLAIFVALDAKYAFPPFFPRLSVCLREDKWRPIMPVSGFHADDLLTLRVISSRA